jgi:hypothetical protein
MHCKLLKNNARRIAESLLSLAITSGLIMAAESPDIRISAPTLGWILAADGSQAIEITGVTDSPRAGRAVALATAARRAWASPDAAAVVLQTGTGIALLRGALPAEALLELPAAAVATVAWDRASAGFAVCWNEICEARSADGAMRARWEVAPGSRVLAYSADNGLLLATAEIAEWRRQTEVISLDAIPASAAFRPGTSELWLLDAAGQLTGIDPQRRPVGAAELVPNAVGLVASLDGKSFFAANAEGAAAAANLETLQTENFNLEDSVEGLWPAAGRFTVRLHDSAKRAIAIWNGDSGTTGWVPAMNNEVRQ